VGEGAIGRVGEGARGEGATMHEFTVIESRVYIITGQGQKAMI
jgi:hypothetical protein